LNVHNPNSLQADADQLWSLMEQLFPICRSMTGNGVRDSLRLLRRVTPIEIVEVPSGTEVFDWSVPDEWNVRDAFVKDSTGRRVVDFRVSNLHLVNGSRPVRDIMNWASLRPHLHTLPDQPDLVPYKTCFHKNEWGFCLSQAQFDSIENAAKGPYEVVVDTTVGEGSFTYGEVFLQGETDREVLFSAHICHPSLANDNLSGICIAALLAKHLAGRPRLRYSYRFLFAPATIGAITWLALNQGKLDRIDHGLVLSLLGDRGNSTYKRSRSGSHAIDQAVEHVLAHSEGDYEIRDFEPFGYDERQFCSPGIDLPMGCLMRTPSGEFAEYHTSGDNLGFVDPACLADSYAKCLRVIEIIENDRILMNRKPHCEPRLDRFGLYESLPSQADARRLQQAVQWVLNLSDGQHSLFEIAARSKMPFALINDAAGRLEAAGLLGNPK
jgi:aminopeptidase-like protein